MVALTTVLLASTSIGSVSVEEAIQKRIAMFKSSGENIKKLNKLIRAGDVTRAIQLVNFHVKWSEICPYYFRLVVRHQRLTVLMLVQISGIIQLVSEMQ